MAAILSRPTAALCLSLAMIVLLWCWLLPSLSQKYGYGAHDQYLESQGIDAGAMFYTEHSRMLNTQKPAQTPR